MSEFNDDPISGFDLVEDIGEVAFCGVAASARASDGVVDDRDIEIR